MCNSICFWERETERESEMGGGGGGGGRWGAWGRGGGGDGVGPPLLLSLPSHPLPSQPLVNARARSGRRAHAFRYVSGFLRIIYDRVV